MSIVEFDGPGEYKIPVGSGGGDNSVGVMCPPPPPPTGILYSPQFRSHQGTKKAARRTQRSTSTISRKNGDCEQSTYSSMPLLKSAMKNKLL